jgi:hypothetical protein
MSNHINYYTSTATRPATSSGATTKVGVPTPNRPRRSRMGPAAIAVGALLVVGAGALVVDSITEPDSPGTVSNDDPGRSQRLVQQSIDEALQNRPAPAETPSTGTPVQLPDAVVAEILDGGGQASESDPGRSQRLVQESIDAALAEVGQDPADTSYEVAEANRMSTLQDLQPAEPTLPGGLAGRVR